MGNLKSLKLPTDTVAFPDGQSITVRGLSSTDLAALFRKHSEQMIAVFDMLANTQQRKELDVVNAANVAASLIQNAPAMMADVICIAAGEDDPEAFAVALSLPAPIQIDAIKKIGRLTFQTEQSAKNFIRTVGEMLQDQPTS